MQKVLVTGATGFLGSRIVKFLLEQDVEVVVLVRKKSNLRRLENVLSNPKLFQFNLDEISVEKYFEGNKVQAIIHTATCYGRENESWAEIVQANLILPLRLILAGS